MNGLPLSRVMGARGRWAYTLYQGTGGKPFIHALDTVARKAVCIDLDDPALARGNLYELRLLGAARGARLDIRRKGALLATVDTSTFRVRNGLEAARAVRAAAADGNPPGPDARWPLLAAALLASTALLRLAIRRRAGGAGRRSPARTPHAE